MTANTLRSARRLLVAALLLFGFASSAARAQEGELSVAEIQLATTLESGRAVAPTTAFTHADGRIYAVVQLENPSREATSVRVSIEPVDGAARRGVSLDVLLADVPSVAQYALVGCYGGYTTNLPLADLLGGRAWIAHTYDGRPLDPVHGGPARLLVPHLYLWKSAKWVRSLTLLHDDQRGFWENYGYHDYGDPWREQRYQGDP